MRKKLQSQAGERKKFEATFVRFGKKINYLGHSEETLLLKTIIDIENNAVVADHLWFAFSKGFESASLQAGAVIQFEARIKKYTKGYVNNRYKIDQRSSDYKLSHPTKILVVNR